MGSSGHVSASGQRIATIQSLTLRNWQTLFAAFVILTIAFGFSLFCWPAMYRPLTRAHGWNFASANLGGAIILLLIGLLSPVVGLLVDRFTPKAVIVGGIVIAAMALALLSTIHSLTEYYAYCALLGIGASAVSIVPTSILIGPFFSRWRGLAVGFINAGVGLGGFLAPRLTTTLIQARGISTTFVVLAGCLAVPLALTLTVVGSGDSRVPRTAQTAAPPLRLLVRMPMFWIFGTALFLSAHCLLGVQQNLISWLTGAQVMPNDAALILAMALGAAAPGKMISGLLADRLSARAGMLFSLGCVVAGILTLIHTAPTSGTVYWAGLVFGLGYGGIFNASPTIIFESFGTHQVGKALGLFYVFFGLGAASGGEVAALLFDRTHDWIVAFQFDLILACTALVLLVTTGGTTRRAPSGQLEPTSDLTSNSSAGVIARRQLAEVPVASLTSEEALGKTFELVATQGAATHDLGAEFARLDADLPGALDAVHDLPNMPLQVEPQRVRDDVEAVSPRRSADERR